MGRREPRAPPEPAPPNAETVRVIEGMERRLGQVETNQEDMNILIRMSDELNKRVEEVMMQVQ
eukprot:603536-Prorocentrum_lima.AAC.1